MNWQVQPPKQFRDLTNALFRIWLAQNDLAWLEMSIPHCSDIKPSDLLPSLLDDGPPPQAIIQDEEGDVVVKRNLLSRLSKAMAEAAHLVRPAA